jgi:hypothetical protein
MKTLPVRSTMLPKLLSTAVAIALAACGGGGDDASGAGGGNAVTLTCDTAGYTAGSVELPTAAQLSAYAGTYNGDEGSYGPNPGDPFVKSGTAAFVLGSDGSVSYKSVAYALKSICIDKAAGPYGKILYVVAGSGHVDVSNLVDASLGSAWGVSPANGTTIFTKGLKP